jgi:hypothetical protein
MQILDREGRTVDATVICTRQKATGTGGPSGKPGNAGGGENVFAGIEVALIDVTSCKPRLDKLSHVRAAAPLPSTGITRLPRYSEPLRHPSAPSLSLAGVRLTDQEENQIVILASATWHIYHTVSLPPLRARIRATSAQFAARMRYQVPSVAPFWSSQYDRRIRRFGHAPNCNTARRSTGNLCRFFHALHKSGSVENSFRGIFRGEGILSYCSFCSSRRRQIVKQRHYRTLREATQEAVRIGIRRCLLAAMIRCHLSGDRQIFKKREHQGGQHRSLSIPQRRHGFSAITSPMRKRRC